MKLIALSTVGLLGGIVCGSWGLMPQTNSRLSTIAETSPVVRVDADKPVLFTDPDAPSRELVAVASSAEKVSTTVKSSISSAESNLRHKVTLLEKGREFLHKTADYTAKFRKREVVQGELLDEQIMFVKCRPQPLDVYLLWLEGDVGREVLYREGANNGKLIAHDGGWKARIPAFSLSVDCMLAMRDSRYPVTMAGLLGLTEIMLGIHRDDLGRLNFASCELDDQQSIDQRACFCFTTKYQSQSDSPTYRKSVTWIDQERGVPLQSWHYEWSNPKLASSANETELDQATLIESYSFEEVQFDRGLSDQDFDRANSEYHFR